jgi:hypothetical protein
LGPKRWKRAALVAECDTPDLRNTYMRFL